MAANPSTRVGIDPTEAGRSARSRLGDRRHDDAHELAQVLRQVRGVGGHEARAVEGAVGGEEGGVTGAVAGGVAEGLGDAAAGAGCRLNWTAFVSLRHRHATSQAYDFGDVAEHIGGGARSRRLNPAGMLIVSESVHGAVAGSGVAVKSQVT